MFWLPRKDGKIMKISCLLATHVYGPMVKAAIQSILDQTYSKFELLILVNGNENIVKEIDRDFSDPRIRIIHSKLQQLAHNLNIGLEQAQGEYIARMDSDDISFPDRFEMQLKILEADTSVVVVSTDAVYINEKNIEISKPKSFFSSERRKLNKSFWYTNPIIHPSVMYRKDVIIKAKGYSDYMNEDYSLWLRLLRTNETPFVLISQPLIQYRIHENQSRGRPESYAASSSILLREFLITRKLKYFAGFFIAILKMFFRAKQ